MSAGFVEPLEASAIVMIELAATMISDILPPQLSAMPGASRRFNERFSYRWARIVDFLKAHYIFSQRTEPYWQAHRDRSTWPDRLVELVDRWAVEPPNRSDFPQIQEIFPAASYAYVLYGMGFETVPAPNRRRRDLPDFLSQHAQAIRTKAQRFSQGLPTNRDLINHILTTGLTKV